MSPKYSKHHQNLRCTSLTLVCLLVLSGCHIDLSGKSSTGVTPPVILPPASKVVITPGSVLLPALDATSTLAAEAFDVDGLPVAGTAVWTSSHPEIVSVDANGLLTALGSIGSAIITAEVNGVTSPPVTALVASILPGVLLIDDSQVVGNFVLVDPAAVFVVGSQYEVTLTGITAPAIGAILLGTGEAPVGGEVMAVENIGGDVVVTLKLLPMNQVFAEFSINEVYDLANVETQLTELTDQFYTVERQADGSDVYTLRDTPLPRKTENVVEEQVAGPDEFLIVGPFECTTTATTLPFALNVLPVKFPINPKLKYVIEYHLPAGNELKKIAVEGFVESELSIKPAFTAALEAKIECFWELGSKFVPVGGYFSLIAGGIVPYGVGFEVGGKITIANVALNLFAKGRADIKVGLTCPDGPGDCSGFKELTTMTQADYKWELPDPANLDKQFRFEPSLFGFGYVKVGVGNKFFDSLRIEALEGRVGLKQAANLGTVIAQVIDATYASDYKLTTDVVVGLASDAISFFNSISVSVASFAFEASIPLDESPKAAAPMGVTVDWARYEVGDTLRFRVKLEPDSTDYFPLGYNVDDIIIYKKLDLGGGLIGATEVARIASFALQQDFKLSWVADDNGDATGNFFAFVDTTVLPLPFFEELELGVASVLDTDGDDMPDGWELKFGLDPDVINSTADNDMDDLNDRDEYLNNTDPTDSDTDNDLMPDGWEVMFGLDPKFNDAGLDPDGDGLTNLEEFQGGTNPLIPEGAAIATGRILFSRFSGGNNEIYVMDADGSNQQNLSNNPSNDWWPSSSPDGTKIAFTARRDGNDEIYVMNPDGTNQQRLTFNTSTDYEASWSPDGTKIAFTAFRDGNNNREIYVMNADGSNQQNLSNNALRDESPSWSPDGTKIVFTSSRDGNEEIYVMNADGTNPQNLSNNASGDRRPSFSPDGTKIVFSTSRGGGDEIYVMNADGSNQQNISNSASFDIEPSWSPDGTKIAFSTNRTSSAWDIYIMEADGSNSQNLTSSSVVDRQPAWMPDISKVVFVSDRDGSGDVYVMNADGNNQTRLSMMSSALSWFPVLAPDGTKVLFEENGDIYSIDLNGANLTNLTSASGSDREAAWSPDATKIAFASNRDGNSEIYVVNADGTNLIRLTINSAFDSGPSWSPDGTRIAFFSDRDIRFQIYSMNADGTDPVNLSNDLLGADDSRPIWSPDGTTILFISGSANLEIFAMDPDGSNRINLSNNAALDHSMVWSPDGSKIVFRSTRDGNTEIYSMNPDGTNQTNLTNNISDDSEPRWLLDGTKIIFETDRNVNLEIYSMDPDGANPTNLTNNAARDYMREND